MWFLPDNEIARLGELYYRLHANHRVFISAAFSRLCDAIPVRAGVRRRSTGSWQWAVRAMALWGGLNYSLHYLSHVGHLIGLH